MNEVDTFLSDDFVQFSNKMSEIHTQLKEKTANVKKVLEAHAAETNALKKQATEVVAAWEASKKKLVDKK